LIPFSSLPSAQQRKATPPADMQAIHPLFSLSTAGLVLAACASAALAWRLRGSPGVPELSPSCINRLHLLHARCDAVSSWRHEECGRPQVALLARALCSVHPTRWCKAPASASRSDARATPRLQQPSTRRGTWHMAHGFIKLDPMSLSQYMSIVVRGSSTWSRDSSLCV
jgi:hypothetical protein